MDTLLSAVCSVSVSAGILSNGILHLPSTKKEIKAVPIILKGELHGCVFLLCSSLFFF
jgi:hypothetical protein